MRVNVQLELSSVNETVTVAGGAQLVDTSTQCARPRRHGRELVDLPLNGRNFTQLGLLQTGVAPLTAGVATAGGSLRQGQAYAVNGMRPEQNIYLVDGAQNNEPDGRRLRAEAAGRRDCRVPHPHAERAARVRRHRRRHDQRGHAVGRQPRSTAASTSSSATTPSTRATSSPRRSSRSSRTSSAARSAARCDGRVFFFGYYEGFRNKQGMTTTATVPTAAGARRATSRAWADAAAQLRRRRRAVPRQPDSRRRRSTRSPRNVLGPVSARQRLAVDLPRDAGRQERPRSGRRPRRLQRLAERPDLRALLRTRAATTSTRSRSAAPTCPAFRPATTSRRTRPRCRARASSRRR